MRHGYLYILLLLSALLLGSCDDLLERDIDDAQVEVVAPKNGVRAVAGDVTFLWCPLEGARSYHLTIVEPSFAEAARVVADTTLTVDSLSAGNRFTQPMDPGSYEWSIRAANGGYETVARVLALTVDAVVAADPDEPVDPTGPPSPDQGAGEEQALQPTTVSGPSIKPVAGPAPDPGTTGPGIVLSLRVPGQTPGS